MLRGTDTPTPPAPLPLKKQPGIFWVIAGLAALFLGGGSIALAHDTIAARRSRRRR